MGTAKGDGYTVTPRDLELIVNAISCTRLPFEIDYDKLAHKLGYKNAQSAKAAWNSLRKKLDRVAEGAPVVPALTIDPEPTRKEEAELTKTAVMSEKKKGKKPVFETRSDSSDDDSSEDSEEPPPPKKSKSRKHARVADKDGDISMGEGPSKPRKLKAKKSSSKRGASSRRAKKPRRAISSSSASSEGEPAPEQRKKLQRKITNLSVQSPVASTGKSASLETAESSAARDKAFEAYGMRGVAGGEEDDDDDDDEPDPPPAYVKEESESGG